MEVHRDGDESGKRRAGEAEALLTVGDGEKKRRLTGEPESLVLGVDECRKRRAAEAESLLLGGCGSEGKKRRLGGEPTELFSPRHKGAEAEGGEVKKHRTNEAEHLLCFSEGEKKKKPRGGAQADQSVSPGGEGKNRRADEHAPLLLPLGEAEETPPTDRTPALIAEALRANGPPPRRLLVLRGSESDEDEEEEKQQEDPVALALRWRGVEPPQNRNRYDPHVDFFFHGEPREEVWNKKWRSSPLVLHDAELVAMVDSIITWGLNMRGRYLDVSHHIRRLLQNHPGPISILRVDSSQFPDTEELSSWLPLLSVKKVRTVILINLTAPMDTEVPLHHLCSSELRYLGIAFVSVRTCLGTAFDSAGEHGHPWASLTRLTLTAVLFHGPDLENIVRDLWGLRMLAIHSCLLTDGCNKEMGLQIESPGLICVQLHSCTATTQLVLGRAPQMKTLRLEVCSANKTSPRSHPIHINLCEGLRELCNIYLPYQDISITGGCTMKVNQRNTLIFPFVTTLVTTVDMASDQGSKALHSFLCRLPCLKRLTISSAEVPGGDDKENFPSLQSVPGVSNSLEHLSLRQFTGCRREVTFILAVLAAANRLISVSIRHRATMEKSPSGVAKFFRRSPMVSHHCRIRVGPCYD